MLHKKLKYSKRPCDPVYWVSAQKILIGAPLTSTTFLWVSKAPTPTTAEFALHFLCCLFRVYLSQHAELERPRKQQMMRCDFLF